MKLPTVLREYDKVARECARDGVDHPRYLLRLIELELIDWGRRTVERRIRAARFPAVKSFDTFDFTAIPSLNKMLVLELARCGYPPPPERRWPAFTPPCFVSSFAEHATVVGSAPSLRKWFGRMSCAPSTASMSA